MRNPDDVKDEIFADDDDDDYDDADDGYLHIMLQAI